MTSTIAERPAALALTPATSDPTTRIDKILAWSQEWLLESRFYTLLCVLSLVSVPIWFIIALWVASRAA